MAKLPYKVECRSLYQWFEPIAAFDCQQAAFRYAADCAGQNQKFDYRLVKGRRILANSDACRHMGLRKLEGYDR